MSQGYPYGNTNEGQSGYEASVISCLPSLFGGDSLKIRHLRVESIMVHLQSFVEDLLAQVAGIPLEGDGVGQAIYFTSWGWAA